MYVVIVCANCGKPSQVAEGLLGQTVECPLCGKPTVALPVAKPVQTEPLSLDDAPSIVPASRGRQPPDDSGKPIRGLTPPARQKRSPIRTAVYATISLLVTLALMGGIYTAFKYGDAKVPDRAWATFSPPGGNCSISLPGEPAEQNILADKQFNRGGKRFVVERWFDGVEVSFGWVDYSSGALQSDFNKLAAEVRSQAVTGLKLEGHLSAESSASFVSKGRKYEVRRYQGDLKPGTVLVQLYFDADPERFRYRLETDTQRVRIDLGIPSGWDLSNTSFFVEVPVEFQRRVIEPGQTIRIYFATAAGKKLDRDMPWVTRFFNSFAPE